MDINDNSSPLKQRILRQRATLYNMLIDPMRRVARRCAKVWDDKPALDHLLLESIPKVPYITYLYALDLQGRQSRANASSAAGPEILMTPTPDFPRADARAKMVLISN